MVPVLYRDTIPEAATRIPPRVTFDLDWGIPAQLELREELLHNRLLNSGFVIKRSGSAASPVTHYFPATGAMALPTGSYIEFIAPRVGSPTRRGGKSNRMVEPQINLHVQTDPHLALLFAESIRVSATLVPRLGLGPEHFIRLPNPICFILQKALIKARRSAIKQANDTCHVYDVAMMTHAIWPSLRATMAKVERSGHFSSRWFAKAKRSLFQWFETETSPGIIAVGRNYENLVSEVEVLRGMSEFRHALWE